MAKNTPKVRKVKKGKEWYAVVEKTVVSLVPTTAPARSAKQIAATKKLVARNKANPDTKKK